MVRWVVGSISHGEPNELFLVLASAPPSPGGVRCNYNMVECPLMV